MSRWRAISTSPGTHSSPTMACHLNGQMGSPWQGSRWPRVHQPYSGSGSPARDFCPRVGVGGDLSTIIAPMPGVGLWETAYVFGPVSRPRDHADQALAAQRTSWPWSMRRPMLVKSRRLVTLFRTPQTVGQ